jgi:hypothetical protein
MELRNGEHTLTRVPGKIDQLLAILVPGLGFCAHDFMGFAGFHLTTYPPLP